MTALLALACTGAGSGVPAGVVSIEVDGDVVRVDGAQVGRVDERVGLDPPGVGVEAVQFMAASDSPLAHVLPLVFGAQEAGFKTLRFRVRDAAGVALVTAVPEAAVQPLSPVVGIVAHPSFFVDRDATAAWVEGSLAFGPLYADHPPDAPVLPASAGARKFGPDGGCVVAPGHELRVGVRNAVQDLGLAVERARPTLLGGGGATFGDAMEVWRGILDGGMRPPVFGAPALSPDSHPACEAEIRTAEDVARAKAAFGS